MPGFLTPALCFAGGAAIGIGLFVALNWDPICERVREVVDEQRMYWEAIQQVREQRAQGRTHAGGPASDTLEDELSGSSSEDDDVLDEPEAKRATVVFRASDSESDEPQVRRRFEPQAFAVYTVEQLSSEDEEVSDNEFSSYEKVGSDFSS